MILLKGERYTHTIATAVEDTVIQAFSLPAESVLKSVDVQVDMISNSVSRERERATMYACAAYIVPIEDPDTAVSHEVLWDRFVPKVTDVDTIDLDTLNADVTPFFEPGEADFDQMFEMGDRPERLYLRKRMLNFANPGNGGIRFQPSETPFEPQWIGAESFSVKINRSIRIKSPSVFLMAIASAALDDTTVTPETHLTETEWGQVMYVESTLERALMDQLNLVEAGATVPWENASALLRKHLAPDVFEETAGAFVTDTYNVFSIMNFSHTVPGKMDFRVVDLTP